MQYWTCGTEFESLLESGKNAKGVDVDIVGCEGRRRLDRSTGIERFRSAAQCRDSEGGGDGVGICEHFGSDLIKVPYMSRDNPWYEVLAVAPPKFDRLVLYPSNQIHGAWMDLDAVRSFLTGDGDRSVTERISTGRLTSNLFGRRSPGAAARRAGHAARGGL